ncbi:Lipid A biosynthesis lauroyltransferase [Dyadobacter sp. CECT 9275]|uniref:Lipid A biosynthesis lauroyltransferase n=1 Tax=Dyadobacter helix TaxID=2822344 RepID=A0A916N4G7_9BACT|nr:lysophospholipid acyltransferase family protein [Dyadobacter sp. CECT 9275]CAG4991517.1 Lipid A biosynthesis lauroyltransferase [Dyadobacter sp. CECT 9275]
MNNILTQVSITIISFVSRWSWNSLYKLSDVLSFILNRIAGYRKKVVLANLRNSFPDKADYEIQDIANKFYRNVTDIMVESVKLNSISRNEVLERFHLNSYLFDKYYSQGKNLVVVMGHLGNWEMANLFAAARLSHQVVVVYHRLANQTFENWIYQVRTRFGSELIPMREAYVQAITEREKPFMFFLVNDQSPNPGKAYWTRFLNQDTGVFRGVEKISRSLNAPVLYASIMRDSDKRGHYEIKVEEITDSPQDEPQNAIIEKQIELLERDILIQPDNWLWSHKRWKHKRPEVLQRDQILEAR